MSKRIVSKFSIRGLLAAVLVLAVGVMIATPKLVTGQSVGKAERSVNTKKLAVENAEADRLETEIRTRRTRSLDPSVANRVSRVRRTVGVTAEDMAAMDMSTAEAAAVLGDLVAWTERQGPRFKDIEGRQRKARTEMRELQRQINLGTAPSGWRQRHNSQRQDLHEAREAEQKLMEEADQWVARKLRRGQEKLREAAKANPGTRGALRYAESDASAKLPAAKRDAAVPAVLANRLDQQKARGLSRTQKQEFAVLSDRIDERLRDIHEAERLVFEPPVE